MKYINTINRAENDIATERDFVRLFFEDLRFDEHIHDAFAVT